MRILYVLIALGLIMGSSWFYKLCWGKPNRFNHFVERAMIQIVLADPELLSNLGIIDNTPFDFFSGKLTDISYASNMKYQRRFHDLLVILHRYERSKLSQQEQLTYDILEHFLSKYLESASFSYGSYESATNSFNPYPVNQVFGMQSYLPNFMVNVHRVIDKKSAERYIARLSQWKMKFRNLIEELKLRERNGVIPPRFVIEKILAEMKEFIQPLPKKNILFTTLGLKLDKIELFEPDKSRIEQMTLEVIETKIYPAYRELITFLEGQLKRATDDAGVWKFPNGDIYYRGALSYHTTTQDSPEAIHALGLIEVERIQKEIRQILDRLGFQGQPIGSSMQKIAKNVDFLYPDSDEGRAEILGDFHRIFEKIQDKLPAFFKQLPKAKLKIEAVPDFKARTSPIAYYEPGDLKGVRPAVFYVNIHDMKTPTKFIMPAIAYHEGLPGHHLQIARAQEIPNLPTFRKAISFNSYVEGWALYCEKLASEVGWISNPYDELGRLQFEMMRAVRLVVDTGIHHKRWTRSQAIEYMKKTTGQNENEVAIEIDRYIVMPGQACSYKIGMIKLLELREKMKQQMGLNFDIKEFHEIVLKNGAMPLFLLENNFLDSKVLQLKK